MFSSKKLNSSQEILSLMNCRRLPARLSTGEAAAILGFQEHDIAPLIAVKLLMPLGKPQATRALAKYWQGKNQRKKTTRSGMPTFDAVA